MTDESISGFQQGHKRFSVEEVVAIFVSAKAGMAATATRPIRSFLVAFMRGAFLLRVHNGGFCPGGLLPDLLTGRMNSAAQVLQRFMDKNLRSPHGLLG
jgi:hypothetical protein